jgi:diguanylate cyclase (GGDEF)-like protein/PAS domain S-box-containing protein
MLLPFVVQIVGTVFLLSSLPNYYWIICICGMMLILSIAFAVLATHWISQAIKYTGEALRQNEALLKSFLDNAPTPISIKDLEGTYLSINKEFAYWMQRPEEEILGKKDQDFFPDEVIQRLRNMEKQVIFEEISLSFEQAVLLPDGLHTFIITKFPIIDEQNKVQRLGGIYLNISDRKRAEAVMQASEARFQKITLTSPEALYILVRHTDGSTYFEYASAAAEDLLGVSIEYLQHSPNLRYELFHPDDLTGYEQAMVKSFQTMQPFYHEWRITTPKGQTKWISSNAIPERRENGDVAWYGFAIDISDRKQADLALAQTEAEVRRVNLELQKLVNLDGLTQIANRRCFNDRIVLEWNRLHREQEPLSLLMFDVDYFKRYNDFYGHQLGDECLIKIAQAVDKLMCRPADLVARYGGEEFIVILPNTNTKGAIAVAERIHTAIKELQIPHQDSNASDIVTVSLGIVCDIPKLEISPHVMINQADQALYSAKQQGRNRSILFTD